MPRNWETQKFVFFGVPKKGLGGLSVGLFCTGEPGGRGSVGGLSPPSRGDSECRRGPLRQAWECPPGLSAGCGLGRGTLENKTKALKEFNICYFIFLE